METPIDDTDYSPFYIKDKVYAITINPNDQHQGNTSHAHETIAFLKDKRWTRLEKFRTVWHDKFLHLSRNGIDHFLWIELSEVRETNSHSSVPRLHFHGYIRFRTNDSIKFWLLHSYEWLSDMSNIKIKEVSDTEGWTKYCTKFQHIMNTLPLSNMDEITSLVPTVPRPSTERSGVKTTVDVAKQHALYQAPTETVTCRKAVQESSARPRRIFKKKYKK